MIAVDSSAVIAILWDEPGAKALRARLAEAGAAAISAGSALELQFVLARIGIAEAWDDVEALFAAYRISVRAFDETQLAIARDAALRFGKGRHKAALNFGDCFAYALARAEDMPLLFVGDDFAKTDVKAA